MIIAKLIKKIKSLTQSQYNKIIEGINLSEISCPDCGSTDWIFYGTYERYVDYFDRTQVISIQRVFCKKCGKTHAILIKDIIPCSITDFTTIIETVSSYRDIRYSYHKWRIKTRYHDLTMDTSYEHICLLHCRHYHCIFYTPPT